MLIERAMEEANQEEKALREQEKVHTLLPLSFFSLCLSPSSLSAMETDRSRCVALWSAPCVFCQARHLAVLRAQAEEKARAMAQVHTFTWQAEG